MGWTVEKQTFLSLKEVASWILLRGTWLSTEGVLLDRGTCGFLRPGTELHLVLLYMEFRFSA